MIKEQFISSLVVADEDSNEKKDYAVSDGATVIKNIDMLIKAILTGVIPFDSKKDIKNMLEMSKNPVVIFGGKNAKKI